MSFFVLACCLFSFSAFAADVEIEIKDHQFSPASVTIQAGDKVTWVNHDQDPHNIVDRATNKAFRSTALDTADKYAHVFDKAGNYSYFCTFHPTMTGGVKVE